MMFSDLVLLLINFFVLPDFKHLSYFYTLSLNNLKNESKEFEPLQSHKKDNLKNRNKKLEVGYRTSQTAGTPTIINRSSFHNTLANKSNTGVHLMYRHRYQTNYFTLSVSKTMHSHYSRKWHLPLFA